MKKLARISALLLSTFLFCTQAFGQNEDLLKDVNFDQTNSAIQDIDVSAYLRDISGDLDALDEKYTADSTTSAETYTNYRLQKVQELVNKPGSDCMSKNDLIAYKGQIFGEVSLKGLNPFVLGLRALLKTKREGKKALYDQMVLDANTALAEAEKSESAVNVKMAKTIVKGKIDSILIALNAHYAIDNTNINSMASKEAAKNLGIRNSLEPVEAAKAGKSVCYKIQIKKIPDPVPAVPVSNSGTEGTDGSGNGNDNNNGNTDGTGTTDGSTDPNATPSTDTQSAPK
jgi:hypothetical protein